MKDNLVHKSSDPSVNICYNSTKKLYRAYYHGKIIFWSKNIKRLQKRINKWDTDFEQWYQKSNIHNQ